MDGNVGSYESLTVT